MTPQHDPRPSLRPEQPIRDFRDGDEIKRLVDRQGNGRELLIFRTSIQKTWLVATTDRLHCVLDENGVSIQNAANFDRYRVLVDMLVLADPDRVTDLYRRYYPLFQEAYVALGYPDAYFNDRVIEVIEHLLETPVPPDSLRLVRPHVLYEFENPDYEALSSGQKLLLRIGTDHAAQTKRALEEFRARISQP